MIGKSPPPPTLQPQILSVPITLEQDREMNQLQLLTEQETSNQV